MTTQPDTADKHKAWKLALYSVAMKALERGDFDDVRLYREASDWQREEAAWCFANYAATDMVMKGRTVLLPMSEVEAVDPYRPAKIEPLPRVTQQIRKLNPSLFATTSQRKELTNG